MGLIEVSIGVSGPADFPRSRIDEFGRQADLLPNHLDDAAEQAIRIGDAHLHANSVRPEEMDAQVPGHVSAAP